MSRMLSGGPFTPNLNYQGLSPESWSYYYAPVKNPAERLILIELSTGGYGDDPTLPMHRDIRRFAKLAVLPIEDIMRHMVEMRSRQIIDFDIDELGEAVEGREDGIWYTLNLEMVEEDD